MLAFDPTKRITVEEALEHPYFASLHGKLVHISKLIVTNLDPEDEPGCEAIFNFDFESYELSRELFQELIWQEMLAFHPEYANVTD